MNAIRRNSQSEQIISWSEAVGKLMREAELALIRNIKTTIAKDLGAGKYQVDRLARIAVVRAQLEKTLGGDWQRILDEAQKVLDDARYAGQGTAIRDLKNAGLPTALPAQMALAVEMTAMDTIMALTSMPAVILRNATDAYQSLLAGPVTQVATGATTRVEATQAVLQEWAARGIPGFVDKGGRQWSMDAYAEMATRTGGLNAMREGYLGTVKAFGEDLVIVMGHGYTCSKCGKWQGKILSASGNTPKGQHRMMHATEDRYMTVTVSGSVAEATADGLFHPNCGHSMGLYLPGITTIQHFPENEKTYKASQQQRALELEVRKVKREIAASLIPADTGELNRKKLKLQKRIRELVDENTALTRKRSREQIKAAH